MIVGDPCEDHRTSIEEDQGRHGIHIKFNGQNSYYSV